MDRTPGPWTLCDDGGRYLCLTISGEHYPIAKVFSGKWGDDYPSIRLIGGSLTLKAEAYMEQITYGEIPKEIAIANALFITKAVNCHDDLLMALETLKNHADALDVFRDDVGQEVLIQINAALIKAKGGD